MLDARPAAALLLPPAQRAPDPTLGRRPVNAPIRHPAVCQRRRGGLMTNTNLPSVAPSAPPARTR